MRKTLSGILMLSMVSVTQAAGLTTDSQKFSYAMGYRMANMLQAQGITALDAEAFSAAVADVVHNRPLQLDEQAMQQAILKEQQKLQDQAQAASQQNVEKGKMFLEKNKTVKGVTTLPNGLQYMVLKSANGAMPQATDTVKVHYHGVLIDGTVFDSSVDRGQPASFALNRVIPGFREAITRMNVGSKWRVFVPSELAYGERGAGGKIGPNETLIFDIELLAVEK